MIEIRMSSEFPTLCKVQPDMVNIMALMADMKLPTMGVKIMVIMPLIVRHKAIYSLVG